MTKKKSLTQRVTRKMSPSNTKLTAKWISMGVKFGSFIG